MAALDLRLRVASPELLTLPWREPLATWDMTRVAFRDVPVGPSRHLVRFVEADERLWALKELPSRVALREYGVLREMERRALTAVRTAGVVVQPTDDAAILVTHYLERSWQYRRLLMRVPVTASVPRARLFDAMAALLVDLHRNGIYWGDCSLANTLFIRDGQRVQAWMVDAETAEIHPTLSDGQRALDLQIMTENVTGGLLDVAARREEPPAMTARIFDEARSVGDRYAQLWELLHAEPIVGLDDRAIIEARLRDLQEGGYEVDEVRLEPAADMAADRLRLKVNVAARSFHADRLRALTGLQAGPGQARILLDDLQADRARRYALAGPAAADEAALSDEAAAHRWLHEVYEPGAASAHAALGFHGDRIQAYCDLLEVRWLLSESAGHDVGDDLALHTLAARGAPDESAAKMGFVELPTAELPALTMPDAGSSPETGAGAAKAEAEAEAGHTGPP